MALFGQSLSAHPGMSHGSDAPLIPGLPDDLALQCLLRIPRGSHPLASLVCRRWNKFVQSNELYTLRRTFGIQEDWLYVLSRDSTEKLTWRALDPVLKKWYSVPRMPPDWSQAYGLACECLDGMLYVMGGAEWSKPSKQDVIRYDPARRTWSKMADMQTSRCYCMSGTFNQRLFVAGGVGNTEFGLVTSVEFYEPERNEWSHVSNVPLENDLEGAAVYNNQVLLKQIQSVHGFCRVKAVSFDPLSGTWSELKEELLAGWQGMPHVFEGKLYILDQVGGIRIMVYDEKQSSWRKICRLPATILAPPCRLVGSRGKLYIVGRGSNFITIDLKCLEDSEVFTTRRIQGCGSPSDIVVNCLVQSM